MEEVLPGIGSAPHICWLFPNKIDDNCREGNVKDRQNCHKKAEQEEMS